MYDDLARSQRPSPLEWLVVRALIPSVLVSFVLSEGHTGAATTTNRAREYFVICSLPAMPSPWPTIPDVFPVLVRLPQKPIEDAGVAGRIVLRVLVGLHGRVSPESVLVLQTTDARLIQPARLALRGALFRPALLAGQPIAAWIPITLDFSLTQESRHEGT